MTLFSFHGTGGYISTACTIRPRLKVPANSWAENLFINPTTKLKEILEMRKYLIGATLILCHAAFAQTTIQQSGFSPLFVGVDYETATIQAGPSSSPTVSRAYVTRVDLKAPGISFITTPRDASFGAPQPGGLSTMSETISQFAAEHRVRIAINANFFAPCCDSFAEPKEVIGLLVSQGKIVALPTTDPLQSEAVLAITRDNDAVIDQSPNIDLKTTWTAVAGSAIIVQNGVDISASSPDEGDPADPNPRTVVGLSPDHRFLYLVIIDGRVSGYSIGTTNGQSAAFMLALGCESALNLDGGGSSEMVRADKPGEPYILNNPSGGAERFDAAALGVYALPLRDSFGSTAP
ncbi:MAG TPA: phosphodiester glycosidase family protein [Silvibacterium sp.]|nr:phosphodiester glycosidase family protein [Silvibacterium sp.]